MAERKERRTTARVTLPGTQIVQTLDGLEAHLLDLSLCGARVAHFGILRPGSHCFVQFPADVGSLRLPVQVMWCVILGAEWRSDGERHLRSHSGLCFTTLTAPQHTVLTDILQQLSTEDPPRQACHPWATDPFLDQPRLIPCSGGDAALLTGDNGRRASGTPTGLVVIRRVRAGA